MAGVHREPGASLFSLRSPETRKKKKRRDVNEMIRLPHSVRRQRVRMPSQKRMNKYKENERGRERETLPFSLSIRRSDSGEKEGKRKKKLARNLLLLLLVVAGLFKRKQNKRRGR